MSQYSFLAPDGVTIIPETFDLGRSCALLPVTVGQKEPVYVVKEKLRSTIQFSVDADGRLTEGKTVCPRGQYSNTIDPDGNLYVADGEIFVYDKLGKEQRRIQVEERPISIIIGGKERNILFVTTERSLYGVKIR